MKGKSMLTSSAKHYTFRPHPYQGRSFQIFLMQGFHQDHVGDYLLLDQDEDPSVTQTTVTNLISLLNGRNDLINLQGQVNTRLYFQRLDADHSGQARVLFRSYNGHGGTTENALLTYNPEKVHV